MTTATLETLTSRIGKLLAKAESTSSTAEAAALFAKAQTLASEHAIDLAMARYQHAADAKPEVPEVRKLVLGQARTDGLVQKVELFREVALANDVQFSIAHLNVSVNPIGFPSDLDVVEQLYACLLEQMVRLSDEWVRSRKWEGDTYRVKVNHGTRYWREYTFEDKPVTARVARRIFQTAFVIEVGQRLRYSRYEAERERRAAAEAHDAQLPSVMTLALRDKKKVVEDFAKEDYARRGVKGTWRGSSASRAGATKSKEAGREAGRNASMSHFKALA